jgi:hypothetical protein
VRILAPSGQVVGEYIATDSVAVGGSADVSFFPKAPTPATVAGSPVFHDVNDDPFNQDRWALNVFQIRHGAFDAGHASAWKTIGSTTISDSFTVTQANELVYDFLVKAFIRGETPTAPFADIINGQQVPSYVSGGQIFVSSAGGQGSGVVTWQGTVPVGDVGTETYQSCMVGFASSGGAPSQVQFHSTLVDQVSSAAAPVPATTAAGDILLLQVVVRNGNASPSIDTPAGWSLLARSPDRAGDPNYGGLDQFIYLKAL